ncbi:hypothetical protein PHET_11501 [Paragonimus heterotremus]|uniref:Uncharacterized protein n=1 Tax=Paragonimus heterotremus TaxID=100268 RepID=A0A8J4WME3_9TREM|nr:hypothetical protein PHET_11501 [Paragonimus heterotremus]
MHSCLTLVDYTWRDAEDSELPSPNGQARETAMRWRRITRSLDERPCVPGLLTDSQDRPLPQYRRTFQSDLDMGSGSSMPQTSRLRENSLLLLSNRQRPTYAASRKILSGPNRIWAPAGHCRYLLNRDPRTGEIQWSPESNEIMCSPRSLAEICMACLVRDWPCMLPPRQPSLRNVVSFLFNARDSRTTSQHRNRSDILSGRRAVSVCSQVGRHTDDSCTNTPSETSSASIVRRQMRPMTYHDLPTNLLHSLLGEAILQRDCAAIAGLVANWPDEQMAIRRLIPLEEFPLSTSYLTKPSFVLVSPETGRGSRTTLVKGPSLMDAFILGLLTRQSVCKLTSVDFTGFEEGESIFMEYSHR